MRIPLLAWAVLAGGGAVFGQLTTTTTLNVYAKTVVRSVDDRQAALNTATWDGDLPSAQTQGLLQAMDVRFLRYPGGSPSDGYDWQNGGTSTVGSYIANDFDQFEQTVQALHSQVIITANYGSGTPALAAAWVQYANVSPNTYGVKYWEVGNEVYGSWENDTNTPAHDPVEYATRAAQYIQQMKAADPTIRVGVVVINGEDSYPSSHTVTNPVTDLSHSGWTPVMLSTLKTLGVMPDFLIFHQYPEQNGQETDSGLLQSALTWPALAIDLRTQANDYLGTSAAANIEILCTENNSTSETPGKQTVSIVDALYLADSMANLMQTEINSLCWWDLRNGPTPDTEPNVSSLYGWREQNGVPYGDDGMMVGYTTFYPNYYMAKLMSHFARGGDSILSTASSNGQTLPVYAAKRYDGSLSVLVINKSPTATLNANLTLNDFIPGATATVYQYGMAQDTAAENETNANEPEGADADVQTTTGVPLAGSTFSMSFPPYSATIVSIPAAPPAGASRLLNISSSGYVGPIGGSTHQLYVGFVVGGNAGHGDMEQVLIRGIGPALGGFGVSSYLAQPTLTIYNGSNAQIYSNTGWSSGSSAQTQQLVAAMSQVGAFSLTQGSGDCALLVTLAPGNYSATVSGLNGSAGTALAEVYEVTPTGAASLLNISSRGYVDNGAHIMTDGFVIGGNGAEQLLIRGVGPALGGFGVTSYVADPALRLIPSGSSTIISANDDWDGAPQIQAAIASTGAFALTPGSKDAAVVVTLAAGSYSVQVVGTNGPAGDGLAEVYEVP